MNNILHRTLLWLMLGTCSSAIADVLPYIAFRSQGFNAARELVGWQTQINKSCAQALYGSFSVTPEFTRSFHAHSLANALFADALINNNCNNKNNCNSSIIKIEGTKVSDRDPKALMAENFYLPTDFKSEVHITPRIENFLVDFNLYVGLDNFIEGLYFRIHTPICYSRYDLNFCESVKNKGENPYDAGYFDNQITPANIIDPTVHGLARDKMLLSFTDYVCAGESITGVPNIYYRGLQHARMSSKALTKTRLAEITAAIGWNFWQDTNYHIGLNIRGAAPTGNSPCGKWLFEPIVGNGHHWEFGGGLTTHVRWWCNESEDKDFATYFDVNITSLFSSRQERTFDLCGKPLSRYMLALKYKSNVENLLAETSPQVSAAPLAQFASEFVPVANLTTIPVDVSVPLHIDAVLKFAYTHCNWQFDLGYDFWYRSCEKICKRTECCKKGFQDNMYALKGDAFVYGFAYHVTREPSEDTSLPGIALSASEHNATIFSGTNDYINNPTTWNQNDGIDLPHPAQSNDFPAIGISYPLYTSTFGNVGTQVNTSYPQPIYIDECQLNIEGAKSRGLSNKLFGHVGYTWSKCRCWTPYLGIGGEVEFGSCDKSSGCSPCNTTTTTQKSCKKSCDDSSCCHKCSLSQAGVWIKGGISFN